jgi:hypothetical protein
VRPDLDTWVQQPVVRVVHRREVDAAPEALWAAAQSIRLSDTRALGRLVRVRIPGVPPADTYDHLFRSPPFNVLHAGEQALVSGLVGRIWTLRRDYPTLSEPDEFRRWSTRGTVRVLFATWVEPAGAHATALVSETRVDAVDRRARLGLGALRPLITGSHSLIGREGLEIAVRRAQAAVQPTP